jgi:hypothetical protein
LVNVPKTAGEPKARLVPYARPVKDRKAGAWKGRVVIAPDFDAPLPEDVLVPPRAADAEGAWLGITARRAEVTGDVVGPVVGVSEWKSSL